MVDKCKKTKDAWRFLGIILKIVDSLLYPQAIKLQRCFSRGKWNAVRKHEYIDAKDTEVSYTKRETTRKYHSNTFQLIG